MQSQSSELSLSLGVAVFTTENYFLQIENELSKVLPLTYFYDELCTDDPIKSKNRLLSSNLFID